MDVPAELQTIYEQLITALKVATLSPKPSYSIEGQSVQHGQYLEMLTKSIKEVQELQQIIDPYWHGSIVL